MTGRSLIRAWRALIGLKLARRQSDSMNRRRKAASPQGVKPEVSVLIIGGGVNGIGDLPRSWRCKAIDTLLIERGDFGSGDERRFIAHAAWRPPLPWKMANFGLVNEALQERDRLLRNAPHYAKPLRTTIPIFRWRSGLA